MCDAVGYHLAGASGRDFPHIGVIAVENSYAALPEEGAFPVEIFRKIGVLAGADVVGGEIGEHPGIKCYPGCAVGLQPEAGHLHDAGVAAVIGHPAQQRLQVTALGRGVVQIVAVPRPTGTVCADQPPPPSVRLQDGRQQVGGGRLALGAGNAHQRHPPAGVAVQPRRKHGHHAARVVCL